MIRLKTLVAALTVGVLSASAASAQSLGASITSVKAAYQNAEEVKVDGKSALELKDVDYAGVHWGRIDFIFDAAGHLNNLSMSTTSAAYGAVLQLAELQLRGNGSSGRVAAAERSTANDMQIRVCEGDGGAVILTYEPLSVVS